MSLSNGARLTGLDCSAISLEALEAVHIGVWYWSSTDDRVYWSPWLYRIMGLDPALSAPSFAEQLNFFKVESYMRLQEAASACLKEGTSFLLKLEVTNPVGSDRVMLVHGGIYKKGDWEATGLVGTAQDITDQSRTGSRSRLAEAVFQTAQQGICIADDKRRILKINRDYAQITGFAQNEIIGQDMGIIRSGIYPKSRYETTWQALNEKGYWDG